jgi:chromosome segregation ATPase
LEAGLGKGDDLAAIRAKFINQEADATADLVIAQTRLADSEKTLKEIGIQSGLKRDEQIDNIRETAEKAAEVQKFLDARAQELSAIQAQKELAPAGPEFNKLAQQYRDKKDEVDALAGQINTLLAEEEKYKLFLESSRSTFDASRKELTNRIDAAKEEIEVNLARLKLNRQLAQADADRLKAEASASRKRFNEEIELLRAKLAGDQKTLDALDRRQRIESEIARLMKEQVGLSREQAAAAATQKADAEDALRAREKSLRGRSTLLQANQELDVLRLRAAGKEKEAKALEAEFKARADAVQLSKDANISEEQALRIIRDRQQLLKQIEQNEKQGERTRRRSPIYTKKPGEDPIRDRRGGIPVNYGSSNYSGGLQYRRGLGPAAVDGARNSRPRDPDAEARRSAMDYYNRNLQQNEELLTIWRTLGVA